MEWRDYKLGDVVTLKRGYDLPQQSRQPGPFPIVSSSGITDHHSAAKVKGPGVVTGRYGTLGEVFYVTEDFWPLNTSLYVQDFKGNDPRFISYLLRNLNFSARNAAGAVPGVNRNHLHAMQVRVPRPRIQRWIAGILSAYDDLIENNLRRIEILEEMPRLLYREWFVHFRFPGHEKGRFVDSPLGKIPEGWHIGAFSDIAAIARNNISPPDFPDEEFEHFSIPAFDNDRRSAPECGREILSNKYLIDESCILLSKLNPRIPRVWLPVPGGSLRAITSTEFVVLRPKPDFTREFLYAMCCSDTFKGLFGGLAIGTSTSHQRVKPENLLAMKSVVPRQAVVERFSDIAAPLFALAQTLRLKNDSLRRIRDLVLPRLLSGEIGLPGAKASQLEPDDNARIQSQR